jgi:hypothetical protein
MGAVIYVSHKSKFAVGGRSWCYQTFSPGESTVLAAAPVQTNFIAFYLPSLPLETQLRESKSCFACLLSLIFVYHSLSLHLLFAFLGFAKFSLAMATPTKPIKISRPRSKSSASDTQDESRPSTSAKDGKSIPPSPVLSISTPESIVTSPPAVDVSNTPRKNGRRRYTPRQIPAYQSARRNYSPTNSPARSIPETDGTQFESLIQLLNGQMDGLVDYYTGAGPWERYA